MMKLNNFRGIGLFFFVLLPAALACGAGDNGGGVQPETAVPGEGEAVTTETVTEAAVSDPVQNWEIERQALDEALVAAFSQDEAFVAVAAAAERGYDFAQLKTAVLDARLQKDGRILAEDNTELTPTNEPAGVLDLSNLQLAYHSESRFPLSVKPHRQDDLIPAARLLQGVKDLATSSEIEQSDDDSNPNALLILQISRSGYTLDQIVETIFLAGKIGWYFDCFFLVDSDGNPIRANGLGGDCYDTLFGPGGAVIFPDPDDPATETEPEADLEVSEPLSATLTIDEVQVERSCSQEQKGHAFSVNCEFTLLVDISFEAPVTPAYLYCEARSGIAQGNGEVVLELTEVSGSETVTISGLTLDRSYVDEDQNGAADPRDGDILNRDNDGIFTGLKCGISELAFESRVTFFPSAWAEASCPHPDSNEPANCFGPWLNLADAHAWD